MGCLEKFTRTRFNARSKVLYDILDASGAIRFSLVVPVTADKCCCLFPAFYEDDYIVIVAGECPDSRSRGADDASGWIIKQTPKYEACIDQCCER
jgi:hypothetical protein